MTILSHKLLALLIASSSVPIFNQVSGNYAGRSSNMLAEDYMCINATLGSGPHPPSRCRASPFPVNDLFTPRPPLMLGSLRCASGHLARRCPSRQRDPFGLHLASTSTPGVGITSSHPLTLAHLPPTPCSRSYVSLSAYIPSLRSLPFPNGLDRDSIKYHHFIIHNSARRVLLEAPAVFRTLTPCRIAYAPTQRSPSSAKDDSGEPSQDKGRATLAGKRNQHFRLYLSRCAALSTPTF
jgi:hypothetical protein